MTSSLGGVISGASLVPVPFLGFFFFFSFLVGAVAMEMKPHPHNPQIKAYIILLCLS